MELLRIIGIYPETISDGYGAALCDLFRGVRAPLSRLPQPREPRSPAGRAADRGACRNHLRCNRRESDSRRGDAQRRRSAVAARSHGGLSASSEGAHRAERLVLYGLYARRVSRRPGPPGVLAVDRHTGRRTLRRGRCAICRSISGGVPTSGSSTSGPCTCSDRRMKKELQILAALFYAPGYLY